jgi:hypothetical protein
MQFMRMSASPCVRMHPILSCCAATGSHREMSCMLEHLPLTCGSIRLRLNSCRGRCLCDSGWLGIRLLSIDDGSCTQQATRQPGQRAAGHASCCWVPCK